MHKIIDLTGLSRFLSNCKNLFLSKNDAEITYAKKSNEVWEKGIGDYSVVQKGGNSWASGIYSHAEGSETLAAGSCSHAEGVFTEAYGDVSHAEGCGTVTSNNSGEHAEGKYNVSISGSTIHTVGIGASGDARKNAHTITTDGKHYIPGIGTYTGTETTLPSGQDLATIVNSKTSNTGTVTSVSAGTGLSISGTASVNPTVNIASGYKLPTTTEWTNATSARYIGTTQVQTSSAAQALTGITTGAFSSNVTVGGNLTVTDNIQSGSYVRAGGSDLYVGSASNAQCHQQYDATNKCLKFIFD